MHYDKPTEGIWSVLKRGVHTASTHTRQPDIAN